MHTGSCIQAAQITILTHLSSLAFTAEYFVYIHNNFCVITNLNTTAKRGKARWDG